MTLSGEKNIFEEKDYELFYGDCLEIMYRLVSENIKVDMILTDPPYGTTSCKWDSVIDFDKTWKCLKNLISINGCICLFGTEPFSSHLRLSNEEMYKYDYKWIKSKVGNFLNAKNSPMKKYEDLMCFSYGSIANCAKNMMRYYPQGLQLINKTKSNKGKSRNGTTIEERPSRQKNYVQKYTNYPNNILSFNSELKTVHPTQKPVQLLEHLIKTYTFENDIVLDFAMGSGSTGVAALNLHRKFIGIELEEKYFNIAKNRIENALNT